MFCLSYTCKFTKNTRRFCLVSAAALLLSGLLLAQQSAQKTFASPEGAGQALFTAAESGDQAAALEIFGPGGNDIISSGDPVQDKNSRDQFVARYQEMHRVAMEPDATATLYVGAENWSLPVPLVQQGTAWRFDTETGKKEVLYRRIGRNEYAAIDICLALVEAQSDYRSLPRDGKVQQYAQAFTSDEGKHNGLYWKAAAGEPESPIGPLVADAAGTGYRKPQGDEPSPFHGYYFRILTAQGGSAPGGARNYVVSGNMTGGFAILAYPADYRSSGVMTFIVNQSGIVYQKDLGAKTAEIAGAMKEYAPDKSWKKAE